jgi:hypothetical protein
MQHDFAPDVAGSVNDENLTGSPDETRAQSRRSFLQRSAVVTAAAGTVAAVVTSRASEAANLNALATLYSGWNARNFSSIRQHERDHVDFLVNALGGLGGNAFADPGFVNLAQPNAVAFARLSRVFENTGVATYLGAAPLISDPGILAAAASIALVEARHAGYLNTLLNFHVDDSIVPGAKPDESFESPQSPVATAQAIAPYLGQKAWIGFALAQAITNAAAGPDRDTAILRFALALEYLERDYYNINVPRFLHVMS